MFDPLIILLWLGAIVATVVVRFLINKFLSKLFSKSGKAFENAVKSAIERYSNTKLRSNLAKLLWDQRKIKLLWGDRGILTKDKVIEELSQIVRFDEQKPNAEMIAQHWKEAATAYSSQSIDFTAETQEFLRCLESELRNTPAFFSVFEAKSIKAIEEMLQQREQAPNQIRDKIIDQTRIIEEKTQNFVGRRFAFDAIEQFIATNPRGYFIVRGDPGIGKSALAAQFVKKKGYVHHFNIRAEGISKASNFLTNICAQLIAAYDLDYQNLPPETTQDGGFLSKLLEQIAKKLDSSEKLIIVVDALDEVETDTTTGANVLYLPMTMPMGVYIVTTMRRDKAVKLRIECEQQHFDILQDDADNLSDISEYIKRVSEREGIQTYISKQKIDNKGFVAHLTKKSQGNFIYLRYVIPEIERGAYTDLALAAIPLGLQNYYEDHWQRMRGQDEEAWFKYKLPVVIALTVVKEAISINLIADFSKVPETDRIRTVLLQWQQFLYELQVTYQGNLQTRYRMYHAASFYDFLASKEEIAYEHVDLKKAHAQIADILQEELFDNE